MTSAPVAVPRSAPHAPPVRRRCWPRLDESGLRGRGGAGFPTGRKWRTVAANRSALRSSAVVVNGAEGEPGAFKDRGILRRNPYAALEGALVAAETIGAAQVVIALKRSFAVEAARVDAAIGEVVAARWAPGVDVSIFLGPGEYLFGEETALARVHRRAVPVPPDRAPVSAGTRRDRRIERGHRLRERIGRPRATRRPERGDRRAPALVNNVETFANVPGIVEHGPDWFRAIGTEQSPGSIVCTVSGATVRHGIGEVELGAPLRSVIEAIGGGAQAGRRIVAVLSGVANALVPEHLLDTPASYESMAAIGSGLGAAGLIVFDDTTDFVGVAAGVSRFLAVESCGQCAHCKGDGLALADLLRRMARSDARPYELGEVRALLALVSEGARCNLPSQQTTVVSSALRLHLDQFETHACRRRIPVEPFPIAPIVDIENGRARFADQQLAKQPDWTYERGYSGQWPADRLDDHRAYEVG